MNHLFLSQKITFMNVWHIYNALIFFNDPASSLNISMTWNEDLLYFDVVKIWSLVAETFM